MIPLISVRSQQLKTRQIIMTLELKTHHLTPQALHFLTLQD